MGCIYKGRDTRLNTIVAIKKMEPSSQSQMDVQYALKRF